jgi:nucleoside-diphosphate-sugar epimerase/SAM-dependent methyltransferase
VRVLVTGGTGYIGAVLVPILRSAGHEVVSLDADWYRGCDFGEPVAAPDVVKDVRDVTVADLVGFDAIVHLAAISNDPVGDLVAGTTYEVNHRASVRLAELAKQAGVPRFVFASSCSLYGRAASDAAVTETAGFNPVTAYGESKVLVERDVSALADDTFSPVFMRNATVYGLSPRLRLDLVVNNLVAHALTSGEVLVMSDGTPWRPLVHVDDVCRTALALLEAPRELVHNEAFNVGRDEENYQVRDVAEIVAAAVPGSRVVYAQGGGPDLRSYRVDFAKLAQRLPGLRLTGTVAAVVDEIVAAYRREGFSADDLNGPRYTRLRRIRELQDAGAMDERLVWLAEPARPGTASCLFCKAPLRLTMVDLGMSPLCENFLAADQINQMEPFYPLHAQVCEKCWLVQVEEYVDPEGIFAVDYRYFSSFSESWLAHAKHYAEQMVSQLDLGPRSLVVELGSNDGYLLQYFVEQGVPVLGVEPAKGVADAAIEKGIPTRIEFFGVECARRLRQEGYAADLVAGKNVLAQVPDPNDFVGGIAEILKPGGTVTIEFPHLMTTVDGNQFDQVYHEHFSYFSFGTVSTIFAAHGMTVFDVEELPTHGGSLRIYARLDSDTSRAVTDRAEALLAREAEAGVFGREYYESFSRRVEATKRRLLEFLIRAKDEGKLVVGYGAPGKGNTLLNYCGIRTDLLAYTVDRNVHKHGRFTPGTHIPILPPEQLAKDRPDYVLILPWNLRDEIARQLSFVKEWGGQLVVPIPTVEVLP